MHLPFLKKAQKRRQRFVFLIPNLSIFDVDFWQVLYKLAHTESCKRDYAADCHAK